jgi:hypothetical protein
MRKHMQPANSMQDVLPKVNALEGRHQEYCRQALAFK